MDIRIRFTPTVFSSIVGLLGLAAIVVAIGALTDWRWATLAAGVFALGVAYAASTHEQPPAEVRTLRRKTG